MQNRQRSSRVAFIDMDDTLLGPDKEISPANLAALRRLKEEGVLVAIASGRHHNNIRTFDDLGEQDWVLSSHGSIVRHEQTGEVLLALMLDAPLVREVTETGRREGFSVIAYHADGAYIERETPWTDYYATKAGWNPQIMDFRELPADGFQKVIWTDDPQRVSQFAPSARTNYRGRVNVMITDPELLEFIAPTANKSVGAQALTRKLGIRSQDAFAFGDGNNDVELLQWAGTSVAMDHGRPSARTAARFITPPGPREDAFARAVDLALKRAA